MKIPIAISARHIHLSKKDVERLFGKTYQLKSLKKTTQPEQFATKERVTLLGNQNKKIENVRIIIPERQNSQAEISITDAIKLKIKPKLRDSGDTKGAPKITVIGPKGKTKIPAITTKRHLHLSEIEAKKFKLKNKQIVKMKILGERALIFENVAVRVHKKFKLSFHVDTDEANAAGINKKTFGEIIK